MDLEPDSIYFFASGTEMASQVLSNQRVLCSCCAKPWQSTRYKTCDNCRRKTAERRKATRPTQITHHTTRQYSESYLSETSQNPFLIPERPPTPAASLHSPTLYPLSHPPTPAPVERDPGSDQSAQQGSSDRSLTESEKLALFNVCLELKTDYIESANQKTWWIRVSQFLEYSIGRPYVWESCRRLVTNLTAERREYLKLWETGEENNEPRSDLAEAMDLWIEVVDQVETAEQASKESPNQRHDESLVDNAFHALLTERMGSNPNHRAKRRRISEVDETSTDITSSFESDQPRRSHNDTESDLTDALMALTHAVSTKFKENSEVNSRVSNDLNKLKHQLETHDLVLESIKQTQSEILDILRAQRR